MESKFVGLKWVKCDSGLRTHVNTSQSWNYTDNGFQ